MKDRKSIIKYGLTAAIMAFSIMLIGPSQVSAKEVVHDDADQYRDQKAIQEAIDNGEDVVLKGEIYLNGYLRIKSGTHIEATGATIKCRGNMFANADGVDSFNDFSLNGGTWIRADGADGNPAFEPKHDTQSAIKLWGGNGIKITNATLKVSGMGGHNIELVACKNVTIDNCIIEGQGSSSDKTCEQIQLDMAAPTTAAFVPSSMYGECCENVVINKCTVTGNRGVAANIPIKGGNAVKTYSSNYHKKISVTNCNITSLKTEALLLFNTNGITVTDNEIISNAKKSQKYKSFGLHVQTYGSGKGGFSKGKVVVKNNTIKGGMFGASISGTTGHAKFGKVTFTGNTVFSKGGIDNAYHIDSYKSLKDKGNKCKKW
ncbi:MULTISPECIES: right-handed parallel beta-helix repeat-containing protein [unclassified Butyrivibrio]|uniref:right-handed parallel beta-helix repeat-containing protein n=1 Tax=unclassified Butyrivibrio TaxID=2639466 RepID=UPI0004110C50|nr:MULTISPECIES: right-handed parallel beta-helix repeat-containing protein [unclassified Butyrivibrio]